ncbi:phage tail protein [Thiotrichales bacterium 19S9-12]|nr:phage tail protein [Thiotrichales bacterium 19S9-11]MCF6812499.1 phage tail protein [Thiotrichales bacterium 19S9-12]
MYEILITDYGKEQFAQSILDQSKVVFSKFQFSDVTDDLNLESIVYRSDIDHIEMTKDEIIIRCVIPENQGGFYLRYLSILDNNNQVLAQGNIPEVYKSDIADSITESEYELRLRYTNAQNIHYEYIVSDQREMIKEELNQLKSLDQEFDEKMNQAYFPYWRLSRNQKGTITNGMLDHFSYVHSDCDIHFEVYRKFKSGISWENRDEEEKEILTAMGKSGVKHSLPEFNIIRVRWTKKDASSLGRLFFQFVNYHGWITSACYAKLVSGSIGYGFALEGVTDQWGLCGNYIRLTGTSYIHTHPYAESDTGEVLFCLLGTMAGYFPLNREKPMWGLFPYIQQIMD